MKMLTKRMKTIMTAIMILRIIIFVEDGDDVVVDVAVKMVITIFVKNTVAE